MSGKAASTEDTRSQQTMWLLCYTIANPLQAPVTSMRPSIPNMPALPFVFFILTHEAVELELLRILR